MRTRLKEARTNTIREIESLHKAIEAQKWGNRTHGRVKDELEDILEKQQYLLNLLTDLSALFDNPDAKEALEIVDERLERLDAYNMQLANVKREQLDTIRAAIVSQEGRIRELEEENIRLKN